MYARREVVVNDQRHLLHIDTACPHVRRDEDTSEGSSKRTSEAMTAEDSRCPTAELCHDSISLLLHHLTMHGGHREVGSAHFLRQPVNLQEG